MQAASREDLKEAVREIVSHFNKSQGLQNNAIEEIKQDMSQIVTNMRELRFDVSELKGDVSEIKPDIAKVKLAVIDLLGTDRHLHNLVAVLQRKGLQLNESEIFS